ADRVGSLERPLRLPPLLPAQLDLLGKLTGVAVAGVGRGGGMRRRGHLPMLASARDVMTAWPAVTRRGRSATFQRRHQAAAVSQQPFNAADRLTTHRRYRSCSGPS